MRGQPDPTRLQRRKDPLSILGIPILAAIAIFLTTSLVAPTRAAATLQCWRLLGRGPVPASALLCRSTPPLVHLGPLVMYSPIAPIEWTDAWLPHSRISASRMPPRDRARVSRAFADLGHTWLWGIGLAGGLFLAFVILVKRLQKPERIQLYNTRFFADREEVLASGLVVGYKIPWHVRLAKWLNER
jgi:hypothetical protein